MPTAKTDQGVYVKNEGDRFVAGNFVVSDEAEDILGAEEMEFDISVFGGPKPSEVSEFILSVSFCIDPRLGIDPNLEKTGTCYCGDFSDFAYHVATKMHLEPPRINGNFYSFDYHCSNNIDSLKAGIQKIKEAKSTLEGAIENFNRNVLYLRLTLAGLTRDRISYTYIPKESQQSTEP